MGLMRVVYVSAAKDLFKPKDLKLLLVQARTYNKMVGVTGLLIYHQGSFLQILEGYEKPVDAVFKKIRNDPRHHKIKLLIRDQAGLRQFRRWSMGFVDLDGNARKLKGWFDYKKIFNKTAENASIASKLLFQFKDGMWRQYED